MQGDADSLQPGPETLTSWRPGGHQAYEQTDDPSTADLIVLLEPNYFKNWRYVPILAGHPAVQQYPEKCFTITSDDSPIGLLPGVYVSMAAAQWEPRQYRAGCYPFQPNRFCPTLAAEAESHLPTQLFSFRGFDSSPVRHQIFASRQLRQRGTIVETFAWYDHNDEQKQEFLREILDSKFALCPGGRGPTTHRLFETMELGRVPVVLSDQWVAPEGVAWQDCSIRVAEDRVETIPAILDSFEPMAREMGRFARREWEKHFAPNIRLGRMIQSIEELLLQRDAAYDAAASVRRWSSWRFHVGKQWTLPQRMMNSFGNGRLRERAMRLLRRGPAAPDPDRPTQKYKTS